MKHSFRWLASLLISFAVSAWAQSPREQLSQLVTQLQGSPGDTALRERIIKLAQEIKPPPAVPEEAERRLGRGRAAFETAKDAADFEKAIDEFTAATIVAPWLAAPYYNLGLAQEKAKRYREAMASMRWYLLASPWSPESSEVRQKIYSLEYLAEQPPPAPKPPSEEELLKRVDGAKFMVGRRHSLVDSVGEHYYEIAGRDLILVEVVLELGPQDRRLNAQRLNTTARFRTIVYKGGLKWEQREARCVGLPADCFATQYTLNNDGRSLTMRYYRGYDRSIQTETYPRVN